MDDGAHNSLLFCQKKKQTPISFFHVREQDCTHQEKKG